jgi:hypothetical protein
VVGQQISFIFLTYPLPALMGVAELSAQLFLVLCGHFSISSSSVTYH